MLSAPIRWGVTLDSDDATMMRRRSTDMDPSGTVRMLRWVSVFGLLLPVFLLAVVAWIEHSNILTGAERDGTKIVALFREQAGNLFTGHEMILDMVVNRMRDRNRDKSSLQTYCANLKSWTSGSTMHRRFCWWTPGDRAGLDRHARPDQPPSAPDAKCFLALSKNEAASCISQPHNDPRSGVKLFSLSRRMEQGGAFSGIVQVAISADYIVNLWASAAPSDPISSRCLPRMALCSRNPARDHRLGRPAGCGQSPDQQNRPVARASSEGRSRPTGRSDYRLCDARRPSSLRQPESRQERNPEEMVYHSGGF